MKRQQSIIFRVNDREKLQIEKMAASRQKSVADYLRWLADRDEATQGLTVPEEMDLERRIPESLRERLGLAANDSYQQHVALIDLRIGQILERIDTAESGQRWREVKAAIRELQEAMRDGDPSAVAWAFSDLSSAINRGANDAENWSEIMEAIKVRHEITGAKQVS